MKEKYQVVQVGWHAENENVPMVCLDEFQRDYLNVDVHDVVKVIKNKKTIHAVVVIQFKEHVGIGQVCTLSSKVAKTINAKAGQKVIIDRDADPKEAEKLKQGIPNSLPEFLQMLRGQMEGQGQVRILRINVRAEEGEQNGEI